MRYNMNGYEATNNDEAPTGILGTGPIKTGWSDRAADYTTGPTGKDEPVSENPDFPIDVEVVVRIAWHGDETELSIPEAKHFATGLLKALRQIDPEFGY